MNLQSICYSYTLYKAKELSVNLDLAFFHILKNRFIAYYKIQIYIISKIQF